MLAGLARLLLPLLLALPLFAQQAPLTISIMDENGNAVPDATVLLTGPASARAQSDFAGHARFLLPPGAYRATIQKPGFYPLTLGDINVPATSQIEARLTHFQEIQQNINVVASAAGIEPAQVAATQSLGQQEIVNIPYPTTRDIREALPFIPGVVRGYNGQAHVAGAETWESVNLLDGFDISNPVTGFLDMRFNADAVRSIDVQSTRYSAEYPASGGVVAFDTANGDNRLRFSATNFIPSVTLKRGLNFDKWTPRALFSGPIVKNRAWFLIAPDGEYDANLFTDLPRGADRDPVWRISNLVKTQANLGQRNILSASFLVNVYHEKYAGISLFRPQEATIHLRHSDWLADVKDQHYFASGVLLETGLAVSTYHDVGQPLGNAPYVATPDRVSGNYYAFSDRTSRRVEGIVNVYLPPLQLAGKHELRFGAQVSHLTDDQQITRRPFSLLRENDTLYSRTVFTGPPGFSQPNTATGMYVQDRWTPVAHLLVEGGLRLDRDLIVRHTLFSPRLAATWMLNDATKLSAGIGLYHDRTRLAFVTPPLQGSRTDYIYGADGVTLAGPPLTTTFTLDQHALQGPRFVNWSVGVERRLPHAYYLTAEFLERHGTRLFSYENVSTDPQNFDFRLLNTRQDRYRALQLILRHTFRANYEFLFSYTRSRARTNAALEYSLDAPLFRPQAPGPLSWDTPNRIISWGFLPAPHFKKWAIAYSAEWRTGFPFSIVNQEQRIVGAPNSFRFPDYFSLNPFLERRFSFRSYNLALRFGFENVTGRRNPATVNNNLDSPQFLTFSNIQGRAFTARIRLLGRK